MMGVDPVYPPSGIAALDGAAATVGGGAAKYEKGDEKADVAGPNEKRLRRMRARRRRRWRPVSG